MALRHTERHRTERPVFAVSARLAAHRFLSAATIAALPSGDNFRFGFFIFGVGVPAAVFGSAHRRRWAAAIAGLLAAEIRCLRASLKLGAPVT